MRKPVHEGGKRRIGNGPQNHAEQPARAPEVALPDGMAGIVFQRWMKNANDFRPPLQPSGKFQRSFLMTVEANRKRTDAAQGQKTIVAAGAKAGRRVPFRQARPMCLVRRHVSHHHVGVTPNVFGGGLNRKIDAVVERLKEEWRRPGIVEKHARAMGECAMVEIAGTSCTSKVSEPGLSQYISLVFGRMSRSISAPTSGS